MHYVTHMWPFSLSSPQLHIAVANGYRQIARLLINAGAEVDIMDDAGYTPLHVAAKFNQVTAQSHYNFHALMLWRIKFVITVNEEQIC